MQWKKKIQQQMLLALGLGRCKADAVQELARRGGGGGGGEDGGAVVGGARVGVNDTEERHKM